VSTGESRGHAFFALEPLSAVAENCPCWAVRRRCSPDVELIGAMRSNGGAKGDEDDPGRSKSDAISEDSG